MEEPQYIEDGKECEGEMDYDIELCDDTDTDEDEEDASISEPKAIHSGTLASYEAKPSSSINHKNGTTSGVGGNKLHSFTLLDVDVVYKLCSTTVLFKTDTILSLIQVCCDVIDSSPP